MALGISVKNELYSLVFFIGMLLVAKTSSIFVPALKMLFMGEGVLSFMS